MAIIIGLLLWCAPAPCPAEPADPAAPLTIESREVTNGAAEDRQKLSLADVEESRALTPDRLYGLAGFWLLIILAICLIRYQIKDDEVAHAQVVLKIGMFFDRLRARERFDQVPDREPSLDDGPEIAGQCPVKADEVIIRIRVQARLTIDIGYAVVEMALEDEALDTESVLREGAGMIQGYWGGILAGASA